MQELIGMILGGLAVLGLVVGLGGVLWLRKRDQAMAEDGAEGGDQQAQRGGGGATRPVVPK